MNVKVLTCFILYSFYIKNYRSVIIMGSIIIT
jgi:hypothetical protein